MPPYLVLPTHIPDHKADVLVLDSLDVEADGGQRGDLGIGARGMESTHECSHRAWRAGPESQNRSLLFYDIGMGPRGTEVR